VSLTYTTYQTALQTLADTTSSDTDFSTILPSIIDYAEQRIYRDVQLLTTVTRNNGTLTANNRLFTFPVTVVRLLGINPFISGVRKSALLPASRVFIDYAWPSDTIGATLPQYFAMLTDQTVLVGPPPDQNYTVEVVAMIRPTPLSVSNATTFLVTNLPDLFLAASMVFVSGYQKNFSPMSDDPQSGSTWEKQYQTLLASTNREEVLKKFAGETTSASPGQPQAAKT
jgi:hypothetical protein